ncbi:hypothetical protein A3Q56_04843 [Intoshia linei]|uniref:Uncharacterized protein n=1 Tax=Intoshia linei TaxID=1819745 RepID=A0A177B1D4_9BILA|nr:hypothetical protein A3Q56_04843 [Intoshia linei]
MKKRWSQFLNMYDFTIKYRVGSLNGSADALSRMFAIYGINDSLGIRQAQDLDNTFVQMKEYLINNSLHHNPFLENSSLWTLRSRLAIAKNLICAGAVKRLNRDIKNMLRIRCNEKLDPTWGENLPELLVALRNHRKAGTNKSPSQMLFGHNLHVQWHIKQIDEIDNDGQKYRQGMNSNYYKAIPKYRKWDTPYIPVTIPLEEAEVAHNSNNYVDFDDSSHLNLIEKCAEINFDLDSYSNNYVDFDYNFDNSSHLNLIEKCAETYSDIGNFSNNCEDFDYDFGDSSHINLIENNAEILNFDIENYPNKCADFGYNFNYYDYIHTCSDYEDYDNIFDDSSLINEVASIEFLNSNEYEDFNYDFSDFNSLAYSKDYLDSEYYCADNSNDYEDFDGVLNGFHIPNTYKLSDYKGDSKRVSSRGNNSTIDGLACMPNAHSTPKSNHSICFI